MNIASPEPATRRRTSTSHIEIRLAKPGDETKLVDLLELFFSLSAWKGAMRFHRDKTLLHLTGVLAMGRAPYIMALDGDELVGVCSYHIWSSCTDPIAVLDECFVLPRLRRTDLGRRLIFLALHLAKGDGCVAFHFPIASGMPAQNSLMNMVGRHFGAEYIGTIFRKVL